MAKENTISRMGAENMNSVSRPRVDIKEVGQTPLSRLGAKELNSKSLPCLGADHVGDWVSSGGHQERGANPNNERNEA